MIINPPTYIPSLIYLIITNRTHSGSCLSLATTDVHGGNKLNSSFRYDTYIRESLLIP